MQGICKEDKARKGQQVRNGRQLVRGNHSGLQHDGLTQARNSGRVGVQDRMGGQEGRGGVQGVHPGEMCRREMQPRVSQGGKANDDKGTKVCNQDQRGPKEPRQQD